MKIVDGREIAKAITNKIGIKNKKLAQSGIKVKLAAVLVGNDQASLSFIRKKEELCREVGISFELFKFPVNISEKMLLEKINIIQSDRGLNGLIIQLPLPKKINTRNVLEAIREEIDVDCLTSKNLGLLTAGIPIILPPTSAAIMEIIDRYNIKYQRKHIVLVGRGELVGKPLGVILTQKQNTITLCGGNTRNLAKYTKRGDIIISAVGKKNLIKGNMLKEKAVILDAGTVMLNNKLFGDVEYQSAAKKAAIITPVPGGIGPITVAKLLENTLILAKKSNVDKLS